MKKIILYVCMLLLGIFLGYSAFAKYYPNVLFMGMKNKIKPVENTFNFAQLPDANSQFVVKPNPDFLYSTCFYNLEEGPLHITTDLPDSSYWSVAFYEPNTVNFYVKNDLEFHSNKLNMIVAQTDEVLPTNAEDFEIVRSPSKKGLILLRFLVMDNSPENVAKFTDYQKSVQVEVMK